jgi:uncharacterized membrane protein
MQNPPGPPPSNPPPSNMPVTTSAGVDKKTGATLSYLFWWITGLIFLFVGKNDPDIKFHAAQSIVFFGAITVVRIILALIGAFLPAGVGVVLGIISLLILLFALVVWVMAMYKAWTGGGARFDLPIVGSFVAPYAQQLADGVK